MPLDTPDSTELDTTRRKYDIHHARVKENRAKLLSILERTVSNKEMVLDAVEPLKERVIIALMDLATGVLMEDTNTPPNKNGVKKERTYRKSPNITALTKLLSLIDVNTNDAASALLRYTQSEGQMMEVDAGVAIAKVRNLDSQTTFNQKQTEVFEKSLVSEDEMNDALLGQAYEALAVFQAESRETLLAAAQSDESFSLWIAHKGERMKKTMKDFLKPYGLVLEEQETEDMGDYVPSGENDDAE